MPWFMCRGEKTNCRNLFSSHYVSPGDKTDYQAWQQVPLLGDQNQDFSLGGGGIEVTHSPDWP